MAEGDKKVSELTAQSTLESGSVFYTLIPDLNSETGYSSRKITVENIADGMFDDMEFPLDLDTTAKSIFGAVNELKDGLDDVAFTTVSGTLTAGSTSITLSDASITTSSYIFPWSSVWGLVPSSVTPSTGSVTLTFPVQQSDVTVEVRVY